jgi:protoporphyrinogen oxidase
MARDYFPTVIIGAGPTGLSAAYHLPGAYLLVEQAEQAGGICRSVARDGFIFDYARDTLRGRDPQVRRLLVDLLGDNMHFQPSKIGIYANGAYNPYPFDGTPGGAETYFVYPLHGGMQALVGGFGQTVRNIRLGSRVTKIDVRRHSLTINGTQEIGYDRLISTLPLPELAGVTPALPRAVRAAIGGLQHVAISGVTLGIDRASVTRRHRIYYPEPAFIMESIFVQGNASPHLCPDGTSSLILEIHHAPDKPGTEADLIERGIADAIKAGLLTPDDPILVADQFTLEYGAVVDTPDSARQVAAAHDWLRQYDIYAAGRFGAWANLPLDAALLAGWQVAEEVAGTLPAPSGAVTVPESPASVNRAALGSASNAPIHGTAAPLSELPPH